MSLPSAQPAVAIPG